MADWACVVTSIDELKKACLQDTEEFGGNRTLFYKSRPRSPMRVLIGDLFYDPEHGWDLYDDSAHSFETDAELDAYLDLDQLFAGTLFVEMDD